MANMANTSTPTDQPPLSPLELPHILLEVFSYLDQVFLSPCLTVNSVWYENALPFRWHTCYQVIDSKPSKRGTPQLIPSWSTIIKYLPYIHTLHWCVPELAVDREKQLAQLVAFGWTAIRLRTLQLSGAQDMRQFLKAILPAIPGTLRLHLELSVAALSQLPVHHNERRGPVISLEEIVSGSRLQELIVGQHIHLVIKERPLKSIIPLKPSALIPNAVMDGISLLDLSQVVLSAQRCIDVTLHMPNLKSLSLMLRGIEQSMVNYCGIDPVSAGVAFATVSTPLGSQDGLDITIRQFAQDLSLACANLDNITLKQRRLLEIRAQVPLAPVEQGSPMELLARSIVTQLLPRLRVLHIEMVLMHEPLLETLALAANTTALETALTLSTKNSLSTSNLERITIDSPTTLRTPLVSSGAIQQLLENSHTLIAFDIRNTFFDLNDIPVESPLSISIPVCLNRPWAPLNLTYLDLRLSNRSENYTLAPHTRRRLCQVLIKQLSLLTQLRVLRISGGFEFPSALVGCGDFEPLASLRLLEVLYVGFDWSIEVNRQYTTATNSSDRKLDAEVVEDLEIARTPRRRHVAPPGTLQFFEKTDLEWMARAWPRLRKLCFMTYHLSNEMHARMEGWLNGATSTEREIEFVRFSCDGADIA
ncbi:hypothetical protein EC991_005461 [Linnemannia zychae]|nr:hypothetical protein EC991_005461 [Linnemannia zychae]